MLCYMLDGGRSVESSIISACLSFAHKAIKAQHPPPLVWCPSTWYIYIAIPDFRLKTTFMNHDLGSGGKVGLQISDLDAIRFLLQNIIGDVKSGLISIIYYGCRLNYLDTSWCWFETSQRKDLYIGVGVWLVHVFFGITMPESDKMCGWLTI